MTEPKKKAELPDIRGGISAILNDEICLSLLECLPPRAEACPWNLVYSSRLHGFSLRTLYRRMRMLDKPTLFIIEDVRGHVFGAVLSSTFRISEHFYGNGESVLFKFNPNFQTFKWTGGNDFIVRCQLENIVIGSGGGTFGLWLDEDFYHGRTQTCGTFENEPLCSCSDFLVKAVEAWCFY